tara:strand:+ start:601 stop:1338 length:738 start_codon:yes stop_codon:yes gene_type:complete
MFLNLFKTRPKLKELIPDGFVDIHSHVLPEIDDGPKDIETSQILISRMIDLGFSKIIATPHTYMGVYNNTNNKIKRKYDDIVKLMGKKINLSYASEYFLDEHFSKKCNENSLLTLSENYVLVETSFISAPNNLYDLIFQMQMNNYAPILAHPERYIFLHNDFEQFYKLKRAGCKFQLNLLSIAGFYGKKVTKISNELIKNDLIDFVGSDFHNLKHIDFFESNKKIESNYIEKLKMAIENNNKFKQ